MALSVGFTDIDGVVFTVTCRVAVLVHPLVVPVTVYVVVTVGLAVTVVPADEERLPGGAQVYVVAPVPLSEVPAPPVHIGVVPPDMPAVGPPVGVINNPGVF